MILRQIPECWKRLAVLLATAATLACAQPIDIHVRPHRVERSHDYDVLHYRIQLTLHDATRAFDGETTVTLRALRDGFNQVALDAETFTVTEVQNAAGTSLPFQHNAGSLAVSLPRPYAYGEPVELRVRYRAENVQPNPEDFGMSKGYDLGLSFKSATTTNPALVNTLSFPEGARHWFPCYDHPGDKASSEIIVTVRDDFTAIANGRLIETRTNPEAHTRTFTWLQEKPHSTYLYVLAAGPYVEIKDPEPGLPVSYWVYPAAQNDAARSFGKTREILRFFESEFGVPYPWEKYDQITIPRFGGGAESTSATVIGDGVIHDAKAEKDFPTHWLVAHEAAHQWWGDLVTMRDWSHAWINEGFATYYQNAYLAASEGQDEAALDWLDKKSAYLREASSRYQRPIVFTQWETPDQNFDRHSYQKAALVIRSLRHILGDTQFRHAITHFLEKHALQSADTHDLQVAIRESTGQVLDWFFDEWIYKPGHPVFAVESNWSEASRTLELRIAQTQPSAGGIPVFQMPVDIGITTPSEKRVERVWLRNREETFRFVLDAKPLLVRFDEGNHLLCEYAFLRSTEELRYQLEHDDVTGRMWAAQQLKTKIAEPAVLAALERSANHDPFWGVRREALLATANATGPAIAAFWKQRAEDPKSLVRVAAIQLLASRHDPALRSWFLARYANEDSYLAQAEALRALGGSGSSADLPFLRQAAAQSSPRDVLGKAGTAAMEALKAQPGTP